MNDTLTQTQLDTVGCGTPGCTSDHSVIYIHCKCGDEKLAVFYEKITGDFVVECKVCEREVVRIAVKEE